MKNLFILIALIMSSCASENLWEATHTNPTNKPSRVYGSYSAGCLDGGKSLPFSGPGFQFVKTHRRRFYGHPTLLKFIESFAKTTSAKGYGKILVADMAQPRGGPMPSGHASHQVGLDVDVYFLRLKSNSPSLTLDKSSNIEAISTLNSDQSATGAFWKPQHAKVLKLAADHAEVERIFVHHQIKKQLCENYKGQNWLAKIRPWWGHHYHFHVRLKCPKDSPECKPQPSPENTDGCDQSLAWWSTDAAKPQTSSKGEASPPKLPVQCETVFSEVPAN